MANCPSCGKICSTCCGAGWIVSVYTDNVLKSVTSGSRCCQPCSSTGPCQYVVTALLNWSSNSDLYLYVRNETEGGVCYLGNTTAGGFNLTHNTQPNCTGSQFPSEISIIGTFTESRSFTAWYNQFSNCALQEPLINYSIVNIENTGTEDIVVNGTTINPGGTTDVNILAYAGYNTGDQSSYTLGTAINVSACDNCTLSYYTTPGTYSWVCPTNVFAVQVECYGAGGGGGLGSNDGGSPIMGGGGGGGGGYARSIVAVTPGNTYTVLVGTGGAGGNVSLGGLGIGGSDGTESAFDTSVVVAVGGKGGEGYCGILGCGPGTGGLGGEGGNAADCTGVFKFSGGRGANEGTTAYVGGGGGSSPGYYFDGNDASSYIGASPPTGGSNGGNGGYYPSLLVPAAGFTPGGGGGGADYTNGSAPPGGDGGVRICGVPRLALTDNYISPSNRLFFL